MTTTTLAITTSTGAIQNVLAVLLPDGTAAPAHLFVDTGGNPIGPALDATVQSFIAAIEALTVPLPAILTTAAFKLGMNQWQAGSVSAMYQSGVIDFDPGATTNIIWNAAGFGNPLEQLFITWATAPTMPAAGGPTGLGLTTSQAQVALAAVLSNAASQGQNLGDGGSIAQSGGGSTPSTTTFGTLLGQIGGVVIDPGTA